MLLRKSDLLFLKLTAKVTEVALVPKLEVAFAEVAVHAHQELESNLLESLEGLV